MFYPVFMCVNKTHEQVGDVIEKSDYIVVAAALTPETKGLVGAAELARVS